MRGEHHVPYRTAPPDWRSSVVGSYLTGVAIGAEPGEEPPAGLPREVHHAATDIASVFASGNQATARDLAERFTRGYLDRNPDAAVPADTPSPEELLALVPRTAFDPDPRFDALPERNPI